MTPDRSIVSLTARPVLKERIVRAAGGRRGYILWILAELPPELKGSYSHNFLWMTMREPKPQKRVPLALAQALIRMIEGSCLTDDQVMGYLDEYFVVSDHPVALPVYGTPAIDLETVEVLEDE